MEAKIGDILGLKPMLIARRRPFPSIVLPSALCHELHTMSVTLKDNFASQGNHSYFTTGFITVEF